MMRVGSVLFLVTLAQLSLQSRVVLTWSSTGGDLAHNLCEHDAIVIGSAEGLRVQDMLALSPNSASSHQLKESASLHSSLPMTSTKTVEEVSSYVSTMCSNARSSASAPQLVHVNLPSVDGEGADRRHAASLTMDDLSSRLESIARDFVSHAVLLISPVSSSMRASAFDPRDVDEFFTPVRRASTSTNVAKKTKGGIFAKYQILTPGIITSLLITLLVIFPGVWAGISALASIKAPTRMDRPKK